MARYIEGQDRQQVTLLPECLDDFIAEDNPVRTVDAFINELDLADLGFAGVTPAHTGRPSYHPAVLLKIYVYGYLNRVPSSRRLERECQRNVELMWLTGRLAPDFKTIADFRRDNGTGIRLPSMAASSKPSTAEIAISLKARLIDGKSRSNKAFSGTWMHWKQQIAPSRQNSKPRLHGCKTRSRRCVPRCDN